MKRQTPTPGHGIGPTPPATAGGGMRTAAPV